LLSSALQMLRLLGDGSLKSGEGTILGKLGALVGGRIRTINGTKTHRARTRGTSTTESTKLAGSCLAAKSWGLYRLAETIYS